MNSLSIFLFVLFFGLVNDCRSEDVKSVHCRTKKCDWNLTMPMDFFDMLLTLWKQITKSQNRKEIKIYCDINAPDGQIINSLEFRHHLRLLHRLPRPLHHSDFLIFGFVSCFCSFSRSRLEQEICPKWISMTKRNVNDRVTHIEWKENRNETYTVILWSHCKTPEIVRIPFNRCNRSSMILAWMDRFIALKTKNKN